jgi:hypothetical protein
MTCDITIFREFLSAHPDRKRVTLVERERFWSYSSWSLGELFLLAKEVGPNQMLWTYPEEIAECASSFLGNNADELSNEDIEVLKGLIEICGKEDEGEFSYTMIIDC